MKHYGLIKKHLETYETQGKVLEHALESLDNSARSGPAPAGEKAPGRKADDSSAGPIQKYALMMLLDTLDLEKTGEYIARVKPTVYALEYIYHKPLKECSLKEVVDGLVVTSRALDWYDKVECLEDEGRYTFKITHTMGPNASRIIQMVDENLLYTYDARFETIVSDNGVSHIILKG
ncbi:MAG: hypothetical protein A4E28_03080 [Methanocella sp. PtaU1.Bin125]|nr:MAG: hypothetical protein A4E28_03080 [Methanocella sp. PtaU1.Bin125]